VPIPERREYTISATLSNCSRCMIRLLGRGLWFAPPPPRFPSSAPWPGMGPNGGDSSSTLTGASFAPPSRGSGGPPPWVGWLVDDTFNPPPLNRGTCPPQVQEPRLSQSVIYPNCIHNQSVWVSGNSVSHWFYVRYLSRHFYHNTIFVHGRSNFLTSQSL